MKPTPVAVNKAMTGWSEHLTRTMKVGTLTVDNLGRYFDPKSLFFGIVEVDKLRKEEHNRCSPKHCNSPVRLTNIVRNERDLPTAKP